MLGEASTATTAGAFALPQNYPNPFNSSTVVRFGMPVAGEVELGLYDLAGQRVATLAEGMREARSDSVRWDGRDEAGRELASGVYVYRLLAGEQVRTRKLVLVR